jgi:predicted acyltransferase
MKQRLLALDIFRGMTIFFMIIVNTPGSWEYVYPPLRHAEWNGLTPTDLVFPFFVFIVGVAMSLSFQKYQVADRTIWVNKVLKRTALIFLAGLALNWFPLFNRHISDLRIFGVLQRIALAYGIGSLLVIFLKEKWIPFFFAIILMMYHGVLLFFGGNLPLSLEDNAVRSLDLWLLGESHIYGGYGIPFDPEGLLSTLPSVGTVLYGYWVGKVMSMKQSISEKMRSLLPYALGGLFLGIAWHLFGFPINKPIWSSSYVLVTGGMATIFLIVLLWILDEKGWQKWANVFKAFGLNPLISYVLSGVLIKLAFLWKIEDQNIYSWLYEHVFQNLGNMSGSFIQALIYTLAIWAFAWWMYGRKIVIKL